MVMTCPITTRASLYSSTGITGKGQVLVLMNIKGGRESHSVEARLGSRSVMLFRTRQRSQQEPS